MPERATPIDGRFDFEPRYVDVLGSRMAYVDVGQGDPLVFLHGNPTSSYLWRNILPYLTPHGRCIALDLVGMGRSGKPDIGYRFFDQYAYFEAFMETLGVAPATLVAHDWGGSIAFNYLRHHPDRVRALAFMEVMLHPLEWRDFPARYRPGFRMMRTPGLGWLMLSAANLFVELVLPMATLRRLSPEEKTYYRAPFRSIASRRPIRQWPREIPVGGHPADVHAAFEAITATLQSSPVPKLLLHGEPGLLVGTRTLAWARANLQALETEHVGPGLHYLPEDQPHRIGQALAGWYRRMLATSRAGNHH
ncbi:haloalkane dehalogenase [Arhodomonas sp. SL1]|uniref:haloalkane dehalogenase n=1 Tax=Arhodomonas sp. SL1 TaxID=3425691 RepID=UPI003F88381D